jgi:hypothetical protein
MSRRIRPTSESSRTPASDIDAGLNLVVLWGPCSAGVEVRTLESGTRLATLGVRTPPGVAGARTRHGASVAATSVPVTLWDPPAWLEGIEPGESLVVLGTVRRRFFATRGGGRGARAEVEAVSIARATPAQRARAWQRAAGVLEVLT